MEAIYSCKLYKSSTRKEKIQAAIADPVNAELVSQLAEYLDEEYQTPEFLGQESQEDSIEDTSSSGIQTSRRSAISSHGGGGGSTFNPGPSDIDDIDLTTPDDFDESSDTEGGTSEESSDAEVDESFAEESPDVEVEESTEILDDGIVASSSDIVGQDTIQNLKDTLNENEETQGVNRVLIKENELWIHYNDNINLNNIMGSVIELMNSSGYTYLEFNRLARSVNAIVFEICKTNSISTEATSGGE